jgi:hypothetical protein
VLGILVVVLCKIIAPLIERAGQSDLGLHRKQRTLPRDLVIRSAPLERHAASLSNEYS